MEQTDMDDLLSKMVLKTPINKHMEEIGEILARKRAASRRSEAFRHRLIQWSVAASIVVITVVSSLIHFSETDFESGGQEMVHLLPDNSEVIVMPDSRVSYNRFTWLFNRRVTLEGEAVFSVTHGPRFSVGTRSGEVVVLGTRFRVKQQEYDLLVVCYEGSVRVVVPVGELVLQPGQKVLYDSAGVRLSDIAEQLPSVLSFNAVPLEEVIRSIEEIFGVSVTGQEPYETIVFTGFITTSDLDETLEAVFRACGIPYQVSGNEISLK